MAAETMSTLDSVLKIDYLPVIQEQMQKEIVLWNQVKKDKENVAGKRYEFPVHAAWGESSGAIAETGTLPATPGNEDVRTSFGTVRSVYAHTQISSKVIAATRTDKAAFVQAVDFKMKSMGDNLKKDLNFMFNSDGTGALARQVGAVAGQDITVDNSLPLRVNMIVNAFDARTAGAQHNADATISNVNTTTNVVTLVGTVAAFANNDYIFKNTGRGINVMGLLGIVDDGTFVGTFQNIARSGNDFWKAVVLGNSGTNRPLSLQLLQQIEDQIYLRSAGQPTMFYSNLGQRNAYLQLAISERRYVNTMEFDAGFKALEYNGKPWFVDRDCVKNAVYLLDQSVLRFFVMKDIGWFEDDGSILHRTGTNLSYNATMEGHFEMGAYQPNRNGILKDLSEPAGY